MPVPLTFTLSSALFPAGPTDIPTGPSFPTIPSGYNWAKIEVDILQADYENVANTATFTVWVRPNSASPWQHAASFPFVGGARTIRGVVDPPPTIRVDLHDIVGWQVKASWDANNPMTWGAVLTLADTF